MTINTMEFITEPHQGMLEIPAEFKQQWEGKLIKVTLLEADDRMSNPKKTLLETLSKIKISAPEDFSENIDAYLNGEKHA